jgi:formamidopyrimidine-DNA glycosylase
MPELPEVENLRRGLEGRVLGQKILSVVVQKPKLVSGKGNARVASSKKKAEFIKELTGEKFLKIERRAKNLLFFFASGKMLVVHLKMSGQFVYHERGRSLVSGGHPIEISESELPNKHSHVIFELEKGILYYNDTRMFGYLLYYPSAALFNKEDHFAKIGLEPFDPAFTLEYFREALSSKKSKLKTVLMNQEIVTGLGNIYADEAAFEAGVRPTRAANTLTKEETKKLYVAIKRILGLAIEMGGSSVATYRLIDKTRGNYAREHKVYGKTGELCPICETPFTTIILNGRTTVFCPNCQK